MANDDRTIVASHSSSKKQLTGPSAGPINARTEKDMSVSFDISQPGQSDVDDITSIDTMSNSDSKSRHTTFSAPLPGRSTCSSATTPSQSRAGSPVQPPWVAMEADLVGIGGYTKPSTGEETLKNSLSFHSPNLQQSQSLHINPAVQPAADHTPLDSSSIGHLQPGKNATTIAHEDECSSTSRTQSPRSYSPGLSTVHEFGGKSPSSDIITIYERSSSSDNSGEEEDDLDLEKIADDALAQWFGISLSRLARPIRVIYAFEGIKEQCAGILQDEGHYQHAEQDDQSENCDTPEGSQPDQGCQSRGDQLGGIEAFGSNIRKRANGDNSGDGEGMDEFSPGLEHCIKTRGPNKKRRVLGDLSCPYRKRNPRRFNVRDHEDSANKSYADMTALKYVFLLLPYNTMDLERWLVNRVLTIYIVQKTPQWPPLQAFLSSMPGRLQNHGGTCGPLPTLPSPCANIDAHLPTRP
jgi:hypothetical protein